MDDDTPTASQGDSLNLQSSGSLYMPSQGSATSSDYNIGIKFFTLILKESNDKIIEDSEPETEGVKIDGSLLIVPWACILMLLSKCQRHGCSDQVLPSNVKVSRKGNYQLSSRQAGAKLILNKQSDY